MTVAAGALSAMSRVDSPSQEPSSTTKRVAGDRVSGQHDLRPAAKPALLLAGGRVLRALSGPGVHLSQAAQSVCRAIERRLAVQRRPRPMRRQAGQEASVLRGEVRRRPALLGEEGRLALRGSEGGIVVQGQSGIHPGGQLHRLKRLRDGNGKAAGQGQHQTGPVEQLGYRGAIR